MDTTASYINRKLGAHRLVEAWRLLRFHSGVREQVIELLGNLESNKQCIETCLGEKLQDKSILEIGPGQLLKQARFFGAENSVTAIDLDEIQSSWKAFWKNGPTRAAKTLVRKALGVDYRFVREFERLYPMARRARIRMIQGDVLSTLLPEGSFDCIMSFSVFEHLPDPRAVIARINRLLRPGGVAYHLVHIYTSDSGAHDARTFAPRDSSFPYWAHLRQQAAPNCYVNGWRLTDWLAAFEPCHPEIVCFPNNRPGAKEALEAIRRDGLLPQYTDQELMTDALRVTWRT